MFGMKRRAAERAEIEAHLVEEREKRQDLISYWQHRIVDGRLDITGGEFEFLNNTNMVSRFWLSLFQYLGGNNDLKVYIDGKLYERPKTQDPGATPHRGHGAPRRRARRAGGPMILDIITRSHRRIATVCGALSLAIERHAVSKTMLRVYIKTLRSVADDLEREIKT